MAPHCHIVLPRAQARKGLGVVTDIVPITIVLLAAGKSSRMGEHKLLLPINGRPLMTYALEVAARSGAAEVIVVLGHDAEAVRQAIPSGPWRIIECNDYAAGMSASLRAGILAAPDDTIGAVILLADQPLISATLLREVMSRATKFAQRIVATQAGGRPSTPVYFPRALFGELLGLTGDEGGRSVLARHRELLQIVMPGDEDELLDVDDPESFQRVRGLLERASEVE